MASSGPARLSWEHAALQVLNFMFLDKGDLVRIHNFGNFGDLVHAHNLPILQAGVVAAFGQLFSEAVCAGQSASCPWPLLFSLAQSMSSAGAP